MQWAELIKDIRPRLLSFLKEKPKPIPTDRCCISLTDTEVALVHTNVTAHTTKLLQSVNFSYDSLDNLSLTLSGLCKKYNLETTPLYFLLSPDEYQIFLIESLPVKPEEIKEAIGWRVRSLINYPIEEAVIDYFLLPAKKSSPEGHTMLAAIATKASQLTPKIALLKKAGFNLTTIDIPELAMHNLTSLYEEDEKSTAFIYFSHGSAVLNISIQTVLYFTRHINLNPAIELNKMYEQICLELLRYFDYFQSQWRYPSPSRIFVASDQANTTDIVKALSANLAMKVEPYKVILVEGQDTETLANRNLLAFGCTLREESIRAEATN